MGFFSRLKSLISSSVNEMINKAEKPEKMLNQLITEMQEQLLQSKKAVALAIADEKKLEREVISHQNQSAEWEKKAIVAVKAGKDDLAKEALLRKQEHDNAYSDYNKQYELQKESVERLKDSLRDLQNRIDEAQRKKNLLIARAKRAEAQQKIQDTMSNVGGNRSAFEAFDRMAQKVDHMEAQAEASRELGEMDNKTSLEKRFSELENSENSADILLEDLKKKMNLLPEK